jgi:hypothetical protein
LRLSWTRKEFVNKIPRIGETYTNTCFLFLAKCEMVNTRRHRDSPMNIVHACKKGWLNGCTSPTLFSDSSLSAHLKREDGISSSERMTHSVSSYFVERVLMEPVTTIKTASES